MRSFKYIVMAVAMTGLVACTSKKNESTSQKLDVASVISNPSITAPEKAEKLALIAEQLFSLTNFMHSVEMADMALTLDPSNLRAQFYKQAAAPLMALKGLATRVKPTIKPEDRVHYNQQIDNFPDSALKTFLLDGQEDIKNEKDVQGFIDSYITAMNNMRVFLKTYSNKDLTLNANDWSWSAFHQHKLKECIAMQNYNGDYTEFHCPMKKAGQIKLNEADLKGLQHAYAGYQLFYTMFNIYDLSGMKALSEKSVNEEMTAKQSWDFLSQYADFGVYRASSQLQLVKEMGLDFVGAYRWAQKLQKQLCPHGYETEKNRPGYLAHTGICVKSDNETSESLNLAEAILNGGLMQTVFTSDDGSFDYQTTVKPVLAFTNPVKDLKALKPQFKTCVIDGYETESVVQIADPTLNGLFPDADFNYILKIQDPCSNN